MTTTTAQCMAETFDGIDYRRCSRPASSEREGMPVCRQHATLTHIRTVGRSLIAPVDSAAEPRSVDDIVWGFTHEYRFALYGSVAAILEAVYQAEENRLIEDFRATERQRAKAATAELLGLGLDEEAILGRLQGAIAA